MYRTRRSSGQWSCGTRVDLLRILSFGPFGNKTNERKDSCDTIQSTTCRLYGSQKGSRACKETVSTTGGLYLTISPGGCGGGAIDGVASRIELSISAVWNHSRMPLTSRDEDIWYEGMDGDGSYPLKGSCLDSLRKSCDQVNTEASGESLVEFGEAARKVGIKRDE